MEAVGFQCATVSPLQSNEPACGAGLDQLEGTNQKTREHLMNKKLVYLASVVVAMACLSLHAWSDPVVPIGFVSYNVTGTNVAEFDITNLTGPNSFSPSFP